MYVTAHHVIAPGSGAEGINSFCYEHGPGDWGVPPAEIPIRSPASWPTRTSRCPRPGTESAATSNVVAPDSAPWAEIRQSFLTFVTQVQRQPLPWVGVVGRCLFRIGLEGGLAEDWQREIAELYRAARAARAGG